jgi:1-acyl-sn-glycerol-3-phosphate acyltransferase
VLGLAWWALDFPFMRRYTKAQLARRPELAGTDIAATRRACEKFRQIPVAVMNFVEGTRFTPEKHARQGSPYVHLLRPKAGGVAFVLEAMGDVLRGVLDVTIAYPGGRPTLMDLLCDRVGEVRVEVRARPDSRRVRRRQLRARSWPARTLPVLDQHALEREGRGAGPHDGHPVTSRRALAS